MTPAQRETCSSLTKILIGTAVGAITTAAGMGVVIGEDRTDFRGAVRRSVANAEAIHRIEVRTAQDRVEVKNIINVLEEVRRDVRAIREKAKEAK